MKFKACQGLKMRVLVCFNQSDVSHPTLWKHNCPFKRDGHNCSHQRSVFMARALLRKTLRQSAVFVLDSNKISSVTCGGYFITLVLRG